MADLRQLDTLVISTRFSGTGHSGYPHLTFPAVRPRLSGNWTLQLSIQDHPSTGHSSYQHMRLIGPSGYKHTRWALNNQNKFHRALDILVIHTKHPSRETETSCNWTLQLSAQDSPSNWTSSLSALYILHHSFVPDAHCTRQSQCSWYQHYCFAPETGQWQAP